MRYRGTPAHTARLCAHIDRRSGPSPHDGALRGCAPVAYALSFFRFFDLGQRLVTLRRRERPPKPPSTPIDNYTYTRDTATRTVDIVRRRRSYDRAQSTALKSLTSSARPFGTHPSCLNTHGHRLRTPSAWFCCSRFRTLSEGFLVSVSVRVRVSDRESARGRGRASARGSSFGGLPLRP